MYLVINKCVTAVKVSNFSGHYLRNRSSLDIGVSGYIGIVQHKEHPPEVWHIPPGTPCTYKTRLASNDIFSPSNKIHREVSRAKDLPAPRYNSSLSFPYPIRRYLNSEVEMTSKKIK